MNSAGRRLVAVGLAVAGVLLTAQWATEPVRGREAGDGVDLLAATHDYRSWTRATSEPYPTTPVVNALCQPATAAPVSPHAGAFIDVYVNEAGRDAMSRPDAGPFPVGTVIVKEKRPTATDSEPTLLTVMVKRDPGYDPKVGDWEFGVLDGAGTAVEERGRLEHCATCHATKASTDFVFRSYLDRPN